ncbi:MAG TPA: ATP-binding cassette domain-containing protein, partial [Nitrospira sp.]
MITVTDLHKSFVIGEHQLEVLKGISLTIARGELIAIVGASGAGKSTMLHILGLLDRPTKGTVLYEGTDLFQLSETDQADFRNRRIGFVFQF